MLCSFSAMLPVPCLQTMVCVRPWMLIGCTWLARCAVAAVSKRGMKVRVVVCAGAGAIKSSSHTSHVPVL